MRSLRLLIPILASCSPVTDGYKFIYLFRNVRLVLKYSNKNLQHARYIATQL